MSLELHMMIGISGSGKSTFARNYSIINNLIYFSSDELRGEFSKTGDENDQSVSGIVFNNMRVFAGLLLSQGRSVMLDATFLYPHARRPYNYLAGKYNAKRYLHVMSTPMHIAMVQNLQRDRQVPAEVIQRQQKDLVLPTPEEYDFLTFEK